MTQIVLFGFPQSSYVRTARMVCIEKQVTHNLESVAFGTDAHAKLHPWRRVPIMQHGDLRLFETSAIARYIDEIGAGPSLVPSTPAARGVMEQWISAINCYIYDSLIRNYALKYILPPMTGQAVDPAAIAAGVPSLERDLGLLDSAYAGGAWLAGNALSLADLFVAPIVQTITMFPEGKAALGKTRHVARAFGELAGRDSFTKVHAGAFA